jgi:PAS domain S-box-containing protein
METILLVDDDQSARVTLSIALKSEGFDVEIVESGAEALRRIDDGSYQWVISDINMPQMNGIELVQKIQQLKPEMQIILISAYRFWDELKDLRVHGFLEKPIDIRKLYHILRNVQEPSDEGFEPTGSRVTNGLWMDNQVKSSKQKDVIRFKDASERQAFEKRTFDFYELLEKKVEERTSELLEKQRNLEDAYFELRKTKRYLENLIDASPGCVISTDTEKGILSFNSTAETTFGYTREEIFGKNIQILWTKGSAKKEEEVYKTTWEEGRWTGEIEGVRKNGEVFPMSLVTSRVADENGKIIAILEICTDITEAKKMEEQLLYAEKLSVLGQLAPKIAHEINNPLHVISANLQFGQMVLDDKEKVKSCIDKAYCETGRIENLTRQLMDVARPTEMNIRELSIKDLLENAILFLKDVGEIKRLDVKRNFPDDLPPIRGDQGQLEQVFRNLILNASQAMEEAKSQLLTVSVRPASGSKYLEITVADTGSGISEEDAERIFEPFFTTKEKGKGNGLGMPIVKGIIERHNGWMNVKSKVGEGTRIEVYLPIDPEING